MNCLVVVTHPLSDSLCFHLLGRVTKQLRDDGHEVQIENLYEAGFNPVLSAAERLSYYGDDAYDASSVNAQVERLLKAEAIVLLYPTWWFSFPAMLKGWFDRVWAPGNAYDHANDFGPIRPRLHNLRRVLVITTLGSPWWVDRLVMRQPLKRVLKFGILGACSRGVQLSYLSLYESEKADDTRIERFLEKISKSLRAWR